jgi:RNA-binding protein PNO1
MATSVEMEPGDAGPSGGETEMVEETEDGEEHASFVKVQKKRKRKLKSLEMEVDSEGTAAKRPSFPPVGASVTPGGCGEFRRVPVPPHRFSPLKEHWMKIFTPIVEHLKLQIRLNLKKRHVELRSSKLTKDPGAIQKAADFVQAFMLGFEVEDTHTVCSTFWKANNGK